MMTPTEHAAPVAAVTEVALPEAMESDEAYRRRLGREVPSWVTAEHLDQWGREHCGIARGRVAAAPSRPAAPSGGDPTYCPQSSPSDHLDYLTAFVDGSSYPLKVKADAEKAIAALRQAAPPAPAADLADPGAGVAGLDEASGQRARITVDVWPERTACRFQIHAGMSFAQATAWVQAARDAITAEIETRAACPAYPVQSDSRRTGFLIDDLSRWERCVGEIPFIEDRGRQDFSQACDRRDAARAKLDAAVAAKDARIVELEAALQRRAEAGAVGDAAVAVVPSKAAQDVFEERRRQIEAEGWTPAHDDEHECGELAQAAICYAFADLPIGKKINFRLWPEGWHENSWKPGPRRQMLVKAGALILAEIERLDRLADGAARGEASDAQR